MWLKTIDRMAVIYFFHVSSEMILNGKISYEEFPVRQFQELLRCYDLEHSDTENAIIYQNLKKGQYGGYEEKESGLNVFNNMIHVAESILEIRDNEIKCKYTELRRWREITRYIGEDLLVCAFMTRRYQHLGRECKHFCWDIVLGNSNQQLNAILKQGISDNHFHLFGSAPIFPIVWLKLMNNINLSKLEKAMHGITQNRRTMHYHYDAEYEEISLTGMVLQAALMRAVMYAYLNGKKYIFDKEMTPDWMDFDLLHYLHRGDEIKDIQQEIRAKVNLLKAEAQILSSKTENDYALGGVDYTENLNWIFSGERALIYGMLKDIMITKRLPENIRNLLYPYLVIRTTIRSEIVQNNKNVGFENFSIYSRRKNNFLDMQNEIELMVKHAVISSFRHGNIKSLEIRVTPKDTYLEDAKMIRAYDNVILNGDKNVTADKFFYVMHFSKRQDNTLKAEMIEPLCRDYLLRKNIKVKAYAIKQLRERMPEQGKRLRGIDACAQEIGCRPEVFGCVFRELKEHIVSLEDETGVGQLKITYHVGEDFLDLADGLRAIDEAMKFLNMGSGDRFGHATALGLSVDKWYERKHRYIQIKAQDYLDNIVWMYNKILEYELHGFDLLKDELLNKFQSLYRNIYQKNMRKNISSDIFLYYSAWKLRGDEPELYKTGKLQMDSLTALESYPLNVMYPIEKDIRFNIEISYLYYSYHYNEKIRKLGEQTMEVEISEQYVEAVKQIQLKMRWDISTLGIGIETNPSSNLLISTMADYDEHHIVNLYNQGLKRMAQSNQAQLYVSINTDDKGVFHTSLENEYALLASALEFAKDENGNRMYTSQEVYDWIDKIRNMGNFQVFQSICKSDDANSRVFIKFE